MDPHSNEVKLAPFSPNQIDAFLHHYVKLDRTRDKSWTVEKYQAAIRLIPNATELIQTPFFLSMVASVLPKLVATEINELKLYETFVKDFATRAIERLIEQGKQLDGIVDPYGFVDQVVAFGGRLALTMFEAGVTAVSHRELNKGQNRSRPTTRSGASSSVTRILKPGSAVMPF